MVDHNIEKHSSNIRTEEDVFEITDFTNSSDWERFITQIEESIAEWQLNSYVKFRPLSANELASSEWESKTTSLRFIFYSIFKYNFNTENEYSAGGTLNCIFHYIERKYFNL